MNAKIVSLAALGLSVWGTYCFVSHYMRSKKKQPRIKELFVFPVKSCRGFSVKEWPLEDKGFAFDRKWMIVDALSGEAVTSRKYPSIVLIEARVEKDGTLSLKAPGKEDIIVGNPETLAKTCTATFDVKLWKSTLKGIVMEDRVNDWFSSYVKAKVLLVMDPSDQRRALEEDFISHLRPTDGSLPLTTGFADGYPFMAISDSSLEWLQQNLTGSSDMVVEMRRFRPNIVIEGVSSPFEEDNWKTVAVRRFTEDQQNKTSNEPHLKLHFVKLCSRCTVPTINPNTGTRDSDLQPLKTLKEKRMMKVYEDRKPEPCFGVNIVHQYGNPSLLSLRVGDTLEVLSKGETS